MPVRDRLLDEHGVGVVETLLSLLLVLLAVAVALQALAYAQARVVAQTAAADGARAAASAGLAAGIARSEAILAAAGGIGSGLHASVQEQGNELTLAVAGSPPRIFPLSLLLPGVRASASLPLERFATGEGAR